MKLIIVMTKTLEFSVEVASKEETIIQLKQRIHHLIGIPPPSQTLTIFGWELIDGLDFEDYPIISDNTKIDLSIKQQQVSFTLPRDQEIVGRGGKLTIIVKFSSRKINVEIDSTETVRSLKEKIHIMDGTPIKRMSLFFSGREMEEDFRGLREYGIHEPYSEIVVFLKTMSRLTADPPSRGVSIVVQTSSSLVEAPARFTVEMKDTSTVSELRQVVLTRKILPMDDYIFIHKQRIMRDCCSLRWHGVEDGDCLYIFKGTVSPAAG